MTRDDWRAIPYGLAAFAVMVAVYFAIYLLGTPA